MFDTADCDRIQGTHGDAVAVDAADLIEIADYLESITSTVYWEGKSICGVWKRYFQTPAGDSLSIKTLLRGNCLGYTSMPLLWQR